jgi:hypothetical protein
VANHDEEEERKIWTAIDRTITYRNCGRKIGRELFFKDLIHKRWDFQSVALPTELPGLKGQSQFCRK